MDTQKFVGLLVFGVIGVVLLSAFVPIISETTSANTTFENEGYYTMDVLDATTESTIVWEKSNLNYINVNGVDIDMYQFIGPGRSSFTLIGGEELVLRYERQSSTFAGIQGYGVNGYISFHSNTAATYGDKLTITVSNSNVHVSSNGTNPINIDFPISSGFVINPSGTGHYAVMKKADVPANVLGNSEIYLIGVSVGGGPDAIALYGVGSIDDGVEISTVYKPNSITTVSYSEPVATYTAVNGYDDLYKLDKYQFTITYDANTSNATYSYFIVPAEVTAEKTYHPDSTMSAVLDLLPLVVGFGLLLFIVAEFLYRRYL